MKRNLMFASLALLAGSLFAADSSPKDDVKAAAKTLAGKSNYAWKTTVAVEGGGGGGGRFRPGPTEGKTEKDGSTFLSMTRGENTIEAVLKGGKGALKMEDSWQSLNEAAADDGGGQFSPARFTARMLQNFKVPAVEAEDLAAKTKELKATEGVIAGDMTEEGAKSLLSFRPPGGGDGPEVSGAKGSTKFWLKDGTLAKYEYHVQGTISFNGNDREVNRTTTVEIKDVGTTKVAVPTEAAKKLE
jgi:hypothetical protein